MPAERERRNLTYGYYPDKYSTKASYGDWLQGNISRGRTRAKYAKELGMHKIEKATTRDVKLSEGRLAKLAASKPRGKVKQWKPLLKVN